MGAWSDVDRRRSPRVSISVRVSGAIEGNDAPIALGHTRDVSVHGLFIELAMSAPEQPLTTGQSVQVRFRLPGTERPVAARAMIARLEHKGGDVWAIGVDFLEIDVPDRRILERYVYQSAKDSAEGE